MNAGVLDALAAESRRRQNMNGCHGYEHTERVIDLCRRLGESMGADMEILMPAAILHDIAREESDHAERGPWRRPRCLRKPGTAARRYP
jgi:HD superfamily phosphodiesterase